MFGALGLIAGGVLKVLDFETPRRKRKREERERTRHIPRVLEPRLERHLTIGRPELEEVDDEDEDELKQVVIPSTRTEQQLQSSLFGLPLEVRRQIYAEAIGSYVIHTNYIHNSKRFNHNRCKIDSSGCNPYSCRVGGKVPGEEDRWGAIDLTALLKSCRRVQVYLFPKCRMLKLTDIRYSEAIETLYTENTFEFQNLDFVLRFALTVLPERFGMIRHVRWM